MSNSGELAKALFDDLLATGSPDAIIRRSTADTVLKNCCTWAPFGGEYHGHAGLADYFARADRVLETLSMTITRYVADGDTVVVLGDERLKIRATGEEFDSVWCTVLTWRDGLIARSEVIEDLSPLCVALTKRA